MSLNFSSTQTSIFSYEQDCNSLDQRNDILLVNDNKSMKKSESFPFGKCRICRDIATGVHYGVITCEGCKGFFKRCITRGLSNHCLFGNKCIVNSSTRNRCKSCRFRRCIELGMSMDSVKMGRIPKKVKEKALRYQKKYREQNINNSHVKNDDTQDGLVSTCNNWNSLGEKTKALSCLSSATTANVETTLFNEQSSDTILNSSGSSLSPNEEVRSPDEDDLSIALANNLNNNLSLLCLPRIFSSLSLSNDWQKLVRLDDDHHLSTDNNSMTVSKYISKMNENFLVDSNLNFQAQYTKNILSIMKYLLPKLCQENFIFELDFEVTSVFRYIRWKVFQSYLQHTHRAQAQTQRMLNLIKGGRKYYSTVEPTFEDMWTGVQNSIGLHVNELVAFAQDIPGLNELDNCDFVKILNNRIYDFWIILNYTLFYNGETYIITPDDLQYTRYFMNQMIGKLTTDVLHEFSKRLHDLAITQVEHSLIITLVLCQPDPHLRDQESIHVINHCYMYALYIQLCSTRSEKEAKMLFDNILESVSRVTFINQLCKQNIGKLVLDKTKSRE